MRIRGRTGTFNGPSVFSGVKRIKARDGVLIVEFFGGTEIDVATFNPQLSDPNGTAEYVANLIDRTVGEIEYGGREDD